MRNQDDATKEKLYRTAPEPRVKVGTASPADQPAGDSLIQVRGWRLPPRRSTAAARCHRRLRSACNRIAAARALRERARGDRTR